MRVRLTHIDGHLPNLALMSLSAWHKAQGDEVHFHRSPSRQLGEPDYDVVYASAIFTKSAPLVAELREIGCRVSLFVDAGCPGLEEAARVGAHRVELYTGPYAEAFAEGDPQAAFALFAQTARRAQAVGLGVNAGHDLSQANLGPFIAEVPDVLEVSIGHALIGEALYEGLDRTVRNYLDILARRG